MNDNSSAVSGYLDFLVQLRHHHAASAPLYPALKAAARQDFLALFGSSGPQQATLAGIGEIQIPYFAMGTVDSVNLFDLDELIIFSFYRANRARYRRVVDIGANIGLHSIVLAKLGCQVTSYEPDPIHYRKLQENLALNGVQDQVEPVKAAVSAEAGEAEFIRLLGNTTGSHLAGAKSNPYGEMDRFHVAVLDFRSLIRDVDLIKLDAEGEEAKILLSSRAEDWRSMDAIVEVGSEANAALIYRHFRDLQIQLFAQKSGWQAVTCLEEMPTSYKEGSLFISAKSEMPWG